MTSMSWPAILAPPRAAVALQQAGDCGSCLIEGVRVALQARQQRDVGRGGREVEGLPVGGAGEPHGRQSGEDALGLHVCEAGLRGDLVGRRRRSRYQKPVYGLLDRSETSCLKHAASLLAPADTHRRIGHTYR